MLASQNGHTQVVKLLIKENADVKIQIKEGVTALMLASQNGHTQVVELLIKENADVKIQSKEGVTALMLASKNGHTQVVELLLKENADVTTQITQPLDKGCFSPLKEYWQQACHDFYTNNPGRVITIYDFSVLFAKLG